jgi:hypothetical protein
MPGHDSGWHWQKPGIGIRRPGLPGESMAR